MNLTIDRGVLSMSLGKQTKKEQHANKVIKEIDLCSMPDQNIQNSNLYKSLSHHYIKQRSVIFILDSHFSSSIF
jgi:hypothetical protein